MTDRDKDRGGLSYLPTVQYFFPETRANAPFYDRHSVLDARWKWH
jgi:hypothetical protein